MLGAHAKRAYGDETLRYILTLAGDDARFVHTCCLLTAHLDAHGHVPRPGEGHESCARHRYAGPGRMQSVQMETAVRVNAGWR